MNNPEILSNVFLTAGLRKRFFFVPVESKFDQNFQQSRE
jgi:hypothetical protein